MKLLATIIILAAITTSPVSAVNIICGPWSEVVCPTGFYCKHENASYWHCVKLPTTATKTAVSTLF
ncbi:hypothetical protein PIIN_08306 [Serendipita indica DSM 11827]|uniref:CBM1 domain-containing protein n=1 Tax=Serendipita indica (strain DSM 11827) TaxID=1109443 RepID=G4TSR0_SERID|nr:hypothetical protein PIIN_08306 [Serendipita indica DSM 11827]